jgi:putative selenium metabolism hydrolase
MVTPTFARLSGWDTVNTIDEHLTDRLTEICQKLIRIPSLPGQEGEVADLCISLLNDLGFDEVTRDECGNIIGILKNGEGPTKVFDAHLDTVSPGPSEQWNHPPFSGALVEGKIYGRGAMDMKGPASAMMLALSELGKSRSFSGKLVASLSVMEEVAEAVALKHVLRSIPPDLLIICEASSNNLVRAQRGRAEVVLRAQGKGSHSSHPQFGIDAVEVLMTVNEQLKSMRLPSDDFMGTGVQALTGFYSLPYPPMSSVPHTCIAHYDRRLIVNETEELVSDEYESLLDNCSLPEGSKVTFEFDSETVTTYTGEELQMKHFLEGWLLKESNPYVVAALKALRSGGLPECQTSSYGFCTNGSLGEEFKNLPRLGFGPGNELLAHRVDEYITEEDLYFGFLGYSALARMELP